MTGLRLTAMARREVPAVLFVAMEMAWMVALLDLLQALSGLAGEEPAVAPTVALYPLSWLFFRIVGRRPLRPVGRIALYAITGGIVVIAAVAAVLWSGLVPAVAASGWRDGIVRVLAAQPGLAGLAAVATAFALLRGGLLGSRRVDSRGILTGFHLGIGVLFLCAFGRHMAELPADPLLPAVVAFFAAGLFGLGANRWLRAAPSARTGGQVGWSVLGIAVIAAVLFVGSLFWTHVDRDFLLLLLRPLLWLWEQIVRLFLFFVSLFPPPEPVDLAVDPQALPPMPQAVREPPFDWGATVRLIGQIMFYTSVGGLVTLALLTNLLDLMRWLGRRFGRSRGIVYEPSPFGLLDDLRWMLSRLVALLRRLWRSMTGWTRPHGRGYEPPEVKDVRRIYRRFLQWAGRRGWPKPPGLTPAEFLESLRAALPQVEPELISITESYVAVRYGAAVPDAGAVRRLRADWRRVRKARRRNATL